MGAIAGILPARPAPPRPRLVEAIARLGDAMARRAPREGATAVAYDASIALTHRGSSGPGGESVLQPLTNESGTLWLLADGEPSNAAGLRLELIAAGHQFRSACGSEVIVHLYEQGGLGALERLAGSFAFALWDRERQELLLGRDRFGGKPLYARERPAGLVFASEVGALADDAAPTPAALAAFLTLGYLPEPLTVAGDVWPVPPGQVVRARAGTHRTVSLWDEATCLPTGDADADRAWLGARLREVVEAAIGREEAIGIVLDADPASAALLALTRPRLGLGFRTHALAWDAAAPSSWRRRPRVASHEAIAAWFQSEHHAHMIGAAEVRGAFAAAAASDQPSAGACLAQLTAHALSGGGERVWLAALAAPGLVRTPTTRPVSWLWRAARSRGWGRVVWTGARLAAHRRPFGHLDRATAAFARRDSVAAAYLAAYGVCGPRTLTAALRADALDEAKRTFDAVAHLERAALDPPGPPCLVPARSARIAVARAVAALELGGALMSGALRDAERAALRHGLALRTPLLDHRLVEWLAAGGVDAEGTPLLDVLGPAMPPAALRAPRSPAPIAGWMRTTLRAPVEEALLGEDPEGLFDRDGMAELWRGFLDGRTPWGPVWCLATARAWIGERRALRRGVVPSRRRAAA